MLWFLLILIVNIYCQKKIIYISKLNDLLFYKPTVNLELGMTRFINWVKK